MLNLNTPLRILQALFAIISLALNGYVTSWYRHHTHPSSVPNEFPFLLFCAAWTLLILPYLFLNAPLSQSHQNKPPARFFNKYLVLALDVLTALLWFAGFVAVAVFKKRLIICGGHVCGVMVGASAVGAMMWITFLATTILATLHVLRTRGGDAGKQNHMGWVGGSSRGKPTTTV